MLGADHASLASATQVYIMEMPSLELIGTSDTDFMPLSNTTTGNRIVATEVKSGSCRSNRLYR